MSKILKVAITFEDVCILCQGEGKRVYPVELTGENNVLRECDFCMGTGKIKFTQTYSEEELCLAKGAINGALQQQENTPHE